VRRRGSKLVSLAAALAVVGAASGLSGCRNEKQDEEPIRVDVAPHVNAVRQAERDWAWVTGQTWRASAIEGDAPIPGSRLWIRFEDHTWLVGSSGCNRLTASYERRGIDGVKITQIASTRMLCRDPKGVMQQEARYLHLLGSCDAYSAEPELLKLEVDGVVVLRFVPADDDG